MHPVLAAGIWPGVEQGMAQRSVLPSPALAVVPRAVSLWKGWMRGGLSALHLECGAGAQVGLFSHGHRSGTTSLWLYREQRTGHRKVFKLPGDFGVLHFKDCSFSRVKVPLSSISPISAFIMHSFQISCYLFFFFIFLTKPGLGNVP